MYMGRNSEKADIKNKQTHVSNLRNPFVDDLYNPLQTRTIELADRLAQVLLLLESQDIVVGDVLPRWVALVVWE